MGSFILVLFALFLLFAFADAMKVTPPVYDRKKLLSDRELTFYRIILKQAEAQGFQVLIKENLGNLVNERDPKEHQEFTKQFQNAAKKTIDFIVVDRNLDIKLLIILADETACEEQIAFLNIVKKHTNYAIICLNDTAEDIEMLNDVLKKCVAK